MTAVLNIEHGCYQVNQNNVYNLDQLEWQVGRKFDWYSTFISLDSTVATHTEYLKAISTGHDLLIAWKPTKTVGITFAAILAGDFDAKLSEWLSHFASLSCQVVIRWAWEMNGNFMPYNPLYVDKPTEKSSNCLSNQQYIDVWRYVVNYQREHHPSANIRWYWCTNQNDAPSYTVANQNRLENFWPGEEYVDIIGCDSYNTLNGLYMTPAQTWAGKTNNAQLDNYARCTALHSSAPYWIGETGCVDANDPKDLTFTAVGHEKADWLAAAFATDTVAAGLPRLECINWFSYNGTRNWQFGSSDVALAAFRAAFSQAGTPPDPLPDIPDSAPVWAGFDMPFQETHYSGSDRWEKHAKDHTALRHFMGQIVTKTPGGWTALKGTTEGATPGVKVQASAIGDEFAALLELVAPTGSKRFIAFRDRINNYATVIFRQNGTVEIGDGTTATRDVTYGRVGTQTFGVNKHLTVPGTLTAGILRMAQRSLINIIGAVPPAPLVGGGVTEFGQNDAKKMRAPGLGPWTVGPSEADLHKWVLSMVDPSAAADPMTLASAVLYLVKMTVAEARDYTKIAAQFVSGGTGYTAAKVGWFTTAGALIVQSADLAADWEGDAGIMEPVTMPATAHNTGYVYLGVKVVYTGTAPVMACSNSYGTNWGFAPAQGRSVQIASAGPDMPASFIPGNTTLRNQLPLVGMN